MIKFIKLIVLTFLVISINTSFFEYAISRELQFTLIALSSIVVSVINIIYMIYLIRTVLQLLNINQKNK